ncbi:secretion protein HlyD [Desulfuromonas carbonis]|uniref:secretion protein HlyD n=1 Tax=Desulfuromonas sp. DDH964 TaxID=1823759 RepID=UPI00078E8020|nr:secretion protein HlyD [Desulfuromonas sp. DDH964]AMV70962.1 RND family efflux pump membrane fusion protein [Desulfuromonas sp. DDH964]
MKKRIVVGIVLLLVAAAAAGGWWLRRQEAPPAQLTLYGNVDIRKVDLAFRVGGRLATLAAEEGDRLAAGEPVARLEQEPYRDELQLAEAQQAQAAAQLTKLEAGNRQQEIAQARALVQERAATVANLERESERKQKLLADGFIARQDFDNVSASLAEARARLETARQGLKLAAAGFRQEDIAAARADLAAAQARLATARTRLHDTELFAPAAGVLLTRVVEPGAIVAPGQTVATLSLDNPVWVRVYVDEPDLGRLAPGMAAQIYTDSAPDHPYQGQVGFISPEAEFTPKSVQTEALRTRLVYQVRIIAENPDQGLRQGMPVTVRLPTAAAAAGGG